jgi:hypothetical protein
MDLGNGEEVGDDLERVVEVGGPTRATMAAVMLEMTSDVS